MSFKKACTAGLQTLAAAVKLSEDHNSVLVDEVRTLRKAEAEILSFADLAKAELKNVRLQLVTANDNLAALRAKFKQQGGETLEMKFELEGQIAALQRESTDQQIKIADFIKQRQSTCCSVTSSEVFFKIYLFFGYFDPINNFFD